MSDLQVPERAYKRRVTILEQEMNQFDDRKDLVCSKDELVIVIEVLSFQTTAKKRKEKDKINVIIEKLNEELFKQKEHVERVRARLDIEREHWFKNRMSILARVTLTIAFHSRQQD